MALVLARGWGALAAPLCLIALSMGMIGGCATPDADGDGFLSTAMGGPDCDDLASDVHPEAPETCNGRDDDCDSYIDELAIDAPTWYRDRDQDGYGSPESPVIACLQPERSAGNDLDCDDLDEQSFPGALWYKDADYDGHGDPSQHVEACERPRGYVSNADDCDDTDREINPEEWGYLDQDRDGFGLEDQRLNTCEAPDLARRARDCDDTDPAVNPGQPELCNGIDDDCDSLIDETSALDAGIWYRDSDDDSYGEASSAHTFCAAPDGWVADNTDCDDTDPSIYPDAPEYCDDVDTDCDLREDTRETDVLDAIVLYQDLDDDSWGTPSVTTLGCAPSPGWVLASTDCDDTNFRVYPGAPEQCNGIDDDCDGLLDSADDDLPPTLTLYRDLDGDGFGDPEDTTVGCVDGSGYAIDPDDCELLDATVYPGAPEICGDLEVNDCDRGPGDALSSCLTDLVDLGASSPTMEGDTLSGQLGTSLASVGDIDDDGIPDYAVGAPYAGGLGSGEVYLMSGASLLDTSPADALVLLYNDAPGEGFGSSLAALGDINHDGAVDLLVGGAHTDPLCVDGGAAWLFLGPLDHDLAASDADLIVQGDTIGASVGTAVSGGGDIDGDAIPDLLIGAPGLGDDHEGAVAMVASDSEGALLFSESSTILLGMATGLAGSAVAELGDVDGDGLSDVLVGAPMTRLSGREKGVAYLFLGGFSGTLPYASADAELRGTTERGRAGASVAAVGDLDGDGLADLALGAPFDRGRIRDGGAVYLALGPRSGTVEVDDLDTRFYSSQTDAYAGNAVAAAGDLDLDGQDDILIGSTGTDGMDISSGGAWLLSGSLRGTVDITYTGVVFAGESSLDQAGFSVAALGDINGEGLQAALVGAPHNDRIAEDAGLVYLIGAFSWY